MSDYLIQLAEIQQILACLRLMSAGRTQEFFFAMPMFLNGHTHLDLARMAHSKNYAELLDALGNTPYRAILERFPPEEGRIPFTSIENALYTRLMHTLLSIVNDTKGDLHKELLRLCGSQIDAQNVSRILRLKTYFGADPDTIRSQLLPSGGTIPRKILERMLQASTADEVLSLFFTTPAGCSFLKHTAPRPRSVSPCPLFQRTARHAFFHPSHGGAGFLCPHHRGGAR